MPETKTQHFSHLIEDNHLYAFRFNSDGWLVLIRKKELNREMVFELNKVVNQLAGDILRVKEEQRLKLLQQLFDKSADAIKIADENGKLYYINQVAAQNIGLSPENLSEHYVYDFDSIFSTKNQWLQLVQELKNKQQIVVEGEQMNRISGRKMHVEITINLVDINGLHFVVLNKRDISIRKLQEQKINDTKQKLESILGEMSDAIYSVDLIEQKVLFVTPSLQSIFDIAVSEEFTADLELLESIVIPEDKIILSQMRHELKLAGSFDAKFRVRTPKGNFKWIRNRGKYIYDEKGNEIRLDPCLLT